MVQSLQKALNILLLFTREKPELRLTDICNRLELPASTVHRLLRTLEAGDFITLNTQNGKYMLGAAAFIMGTNVNSINVLVDTALPFIARLSTKYEATVHVAIEQNNHVLCVDKIKSPKSVAPTPDRGARHELHLTSVGKCILAFSQPEKQAALLKEIQFTPGYPMETSISSRGQLEQELHRVKQRGYAVDSCESAPGLYCFGAPVFMGKNRNVSAISVSCISSGFPDAAPSMIQDVINSANSITRLLDGI